MTVSCCVTLVWTVLPAFATLPLLLHLPQMSFTDAYFETMSGLTTTGATVMTGLDDLPLSINVWRHLLVWMGGMGIVVLAVAILPLLGVGGSQLYKAETAGPFKESKLTPRIAQTAKGLYTVYFAVSAACFFSFHIAGMSWADAFMHMCSTMGLGGFSSHDASFGYFDSPAIESVAVVFMLIAGFNFSMHFLAWRKRSLRGYLTDIEGQAFVGSRSAGRSVIAASCSARAIPGLRHLAPLCALQHGVDCDDDGIREHRLQPVAALRTGADAAAVLLRDLRGFHRGRHQDDPRDRPDQAGAARAGTHRASARRHPVALGGAIVDNPVIFAVLAFMQTVGCRRHRTDVCAALDRTGPRQRLQRRHRLHHQHRSGPQPGRPGKQLSVLNDFGTWVCSFAMLIGRLELMSVLVLLTPDFWRR